MSEISPVQNKIYDLENELINFIKKNALTFLTLKRVFSKNLTTLDLLYFKAD